MEDEHSTNAAREMTHASCCADGDLVVLVSPGPKRVSGGGLTSISRYPFSPIPGVAKGAP